MPSEELSATDRTRQDRWARVLLLKQKAILRGGKIRVSNALQGDAPELVRARYWQREANRAGMESFYQQHRAQQLSHEARAALDAGDETRAEQLAREAKEARRLAAAEQHRYEVAGFYDAHSCREVILCELREKIAAAGGAPLRFDALRAPLVEAELLNAQKRAREAEHASSFFDHAEKLSSAPANAPGSCSLQQPRKEPLATFT
jgi:hypothetical protein